MEPQVDMIGPIRLLMSLCALIVALVGGIVARDRAVGKRITDVNDKTQDQLDAIRSDMNTNFARKDDVKESVRRVERSIDGLGAELRQNHKDLTSLIIKELK